MLETPYKRAIAVTPHDSNNIIPGEPGQRFLSDAILVLGTGAIILILEDNTSLTLAGVPANTILPFAVKRVHATGTTATNIYALKRL